MAGLGLLSTLHSLLDILLKDTKLPPVARTCVIIAANQLSGTSDGWLVADC